MSKISFSELVGNEGIRKTIIEAIMVARSENQPIPNILLIGNTGCGKTTLAESIANLISARFFSFYARNIDAKIHDFVAELSYYTQEDVIIFIDEIHQLKTGSQELLFPILDSKNITLICATTETGKLVRPFQNRFKLSLVIEQYDQNDSIKIIENYCEKKNIKITTNAKYHLAKRSRGIPRIMETNIDTCWTKIKFKRLLDKKVKLIITENSVIEYFTEIGIDDKGLNRQERKIIKILLENGGIMNIETLCSMCQIDKDQFTDNYEPYLIQEGLITKTPKGRKLTAKGMLHIAAA